VSASVTTAAPLEDMRGRSGKTDRREAMPPEEYLRSPPPSSSIISARGIARRATKRGLPPEGPMFRRFFHRPHSGSIVSDLRWCRHPACQGATMLIDPRPAPPLGNDGAQVSAVPARYLARSPGGPVSRPGPAGIPVEMSPGNLMASGAGPWVGSAFVVRWPSLAVPLPDRAGPRWVGFGPHPVEPLAPPTSRGFLPSPRRRRRMS
jgi:hypothetical protein